LVIDTEKEGSGIAERGRSGIYLDIDLKAEETTGYISRDGTVFKQPLVMTFAHELVHAGDTEFDSKSKMQSALNAYKEKVGVSPSNRKEDFYFALTAKDRLFKDAADTMSAVLKDETFAATLTEKQHNALMELTEIPMEQLTEQQKAAFPQRVQKEFLNILTPTQKSDLDKLTGISDREALISSLTKEQRSALTELQAAKENPAINEGTFTLLYYQKEVETGFSKNPVISKIFLGEEQIRLKNDVIENYATAQETKLLNELGLKGSRSSYKTTVQSDSLIPYKPSIPIPYALSEDDKKELAESNANFPPITTSEAKMDTNRVAPDDAIEKIKNTRIQDIPLKGLQNNQYAVTDATTVQLSATPTKVQQSQASITV
jgi:hypothetical protein